MKGDSIMYTDKEKFKGLFKWSTIVMDASDLEDVINLVHDILIEEADAMREKIPYATNSIREYEQAAITLSMMTSECLDYYEEAFSSET